MASKSDKRRPTRAQVKRALRGLPPAPREMWGDLSEWEKKMWQNRAHALNKRARKAGVKGTVSAGVLKMIVARDQSRCVHCGYLLDYRSGKEAAESGKRIATFDHMIRLADGGDHSARNLACACSGCNNDRHGVPSPAAE